ncbi:E3 ubiquitin-protein ligase TRIM33-like [Branchiostoma floridae x Branchiostoma belcheri]
MACVALTQLSDDLLQCGICKKDFNRPKLLPCLHSFCEGCLAKHLEENPSQGEEYEEVPACLTCPICTTDVPVPDGDLQWLKDNHFIVSLATSVEIQKRLIKSDVVCNVCDGGQKAAARCLHCEEFLCAECVSAHQRVKLTRDHQVKTLEELRGGKTHDVKTHTTAPCRIHKYEPLKFYCQSCRTLICRDCSAFDHRDHQYDYLTDMVEKIKDCFKDLIQRSEEKLNNFQESSQTLDDVELEVSKKASTADEEIDAATEKLKRELCDYLDEKGLKLKQKVREVHDARQRQLSDQKDSVRQNISDLGSAAGYAHKILMLGSNFELMDISKEVIDRLQSLLMKALPKIADDISKFDFTASDPRFYGLDIGRVVTDIPKKRLSRGESLDSGVGNDSTFSSTPPIPEVDENPTVPNGPVLTNGTASPETTGRRTSSTGSVFHTASEEKSSSAGAHSNASTGSASNGTSTPPAQGQTKTSPEPPKQAGTTKTTKLGERRSYSTSNTSVPPTGYGFKSTPINRSKSTSTMETGTTRKSFMNGMGAPGKKAPPACARMLPCGHLCGGDHEPGEDDCSCSQLAAYRLKCGHVERTYCDAETAFCRKCADFVLKVGKAG